MKKSGLSSGLESSVKKRWEDVHRLRGDDQIEGGFRACRCVEPELRNET